ncbi:Hsp70 family protein [Actinoplanes sp. URMC 104]|uniref:Hsp70 family protein n=1 Tax=Actinoplanes sp. URMC 104 TaxID=3423409 RepID=UPI003F1A75A5
MTAVTEGFVLGVDLGTSHTVAMLRHPDGRTRPLLFDGLPLLPSAVFLDAAGRLHVGADAVRLGHAEPGRLEPHPKRRVDDGTVLLGEDASVPVADLLAALLGAVAREAVATAGFLPPATLTCPASWGPPRRAVLVDALARAGWPAGTPLLPEPVAAARYFAEVLRRPLPVGASLAVFDFGAGTLDVAVVRRDAAFSVMASGGADLGGLDLDAALVDHLGTSLAAAEPAAWRAITEPVTLAQWRARQQFWEDVRGAKEMLSRSSSAPVAVPGVEHAVPLTRDELEAAADPLVRRAVTETAEVIAAAGLKPADLAGLFLVGGSSRVPLVARLLHGELGIAPTVLEQPELPVAEGATLVAAEAAASIPPATAPDLDPLPAASPEPATGAPAAASPAAATSPPPSPSPAPVASGGSPADDRHYAEPVDPWATGEAAAIAAGSHAVPGSPGAPGSPFGPPSAEPWLASDTPPGPAPAEPRRRRRWIAAGAAAAILAGAGIAWAVRPGHPALDYHALGTPVHVAPAVPIGSGWKDAVVRGDRAYLAGADYDSGKVGVVAVDTGSDKPAWTNADVAVAKRWESMVALPDGVVLFSAPDYDTDKRLMVVLDGDSGDKLWQRDLGEQDQVRFAADRAVVADRAGKRLTGLDLETGEQRWEQPDPGGSSSAPTLITVTTPADLAGPAGVGGVPWSADLGDDPRLVQITGDRSARVIDARNGDVKVDRPNVASTNDEVVAHNGRLIVRESEGAHRVVAYGLDKLDGVDIVYSAPSSTARLTALTACGDDRVCLVQGTGYADDKAQVVAVDVADGKRLWQAEAPGATDLTPVGEAVLAVSSSGTRLLDADGHEVWSHEAAAARIDAGNVLEFSKPLAGYADDPALAGRHLGDEPVQLGPLSDVQTDTCSWNTAWLACAGKEDFVLVEFAG